MELFKIFGTIAVNYGEAVDDLNKIKEEAKKTSDGLDDVDDSAQELSNGGFTVLKGAIANLVAEGFHKLCDAIGDFIGDGVEYYKSIEQYATSFETMTGSAEKAAEMTQRLQEIGASTPFELPQLADTTQLLMNYGFTADDAINKMTMLGDISQGNADKMSRIAMAYGQMSSAGKVHLEDVKQMIEAGFNPLQEISESTGETMESLYDRISKGTLSVDEITAAMERSTAEGGKYFGAMDAQSETLTGRLSTLKDTANESISNILGPLLEKAADEWLPAVTEAMSKVDEKFTEFGNWISSHQGLLAGLGIAIGIITTAFVVQGVEMKAHIALKAIKTAMDAAETTTLWGLVAAQTAAIAPYLLIAAAIAAVIAVVVLLIQHWDQVKQKVVEVAEMLAQKWEEIKANIAEKIASIVANVTSKFQEIKNTVFTKVQEILDKIKGFFTDVITTVTEKAAEIWEEVTQKWQEIQDVFKNALDVGKKIVQDIRDGISAAWEGLKSWFNNLWDSLFGNLTANINVRYNSSGTRTTTGVVGNGGRAKGLDYVPYDGFVAQLHKGEMIVPAAIARSLRVGFTGFGGDNTETKEILLQILDAVEANNRKEAVVKLNSREVGRVVRGYV